MDAVEAAARSANPMVFVSAPSVVGEKWLASVELVVEIAVERLPGGLLWAYPRYEGTEGGPIAVGPPVLLDPADPQAGMALVDSIERVLAGFDGDPAAVWQIRAPASGLSPGLPIDGPWLEGPSPSAVLERLKAVRVGRGGEVAVAIVEAPRWVVRLSVGGRLVDLRVRGRLIDRLEEVDRWHSAKERRLHGSWRLRGEFPDPSPMLKEITAAILAHAPEAADAGRPTIAVRLEQNASASSVAESPTEEVLTAWLFAPVLVFALALVVAPTTGFFALVHLDWGVEGWFIGAIVILIVATVLTIPAWVVGDVAKGIAERWHVRWSLKLWVRRAAAVGTYAALFAAVSLLPDWAAVLALSVCAAIGLELLKLRAR